MTQNLGTGRMNWKILAIVLLVLFIVENLFLGWGIFLVEQDERKSNICYYDVCEDYPDALYIEGNCACYNETGEVAIREWIN